MHQKSISAGAPPWTPLGPGVYSAPPDPKIDAGIKRTYFKWKGEIHEGEGEGREGNGEEGKGMQGTPVCVFKFSLE